MFLQELKALAERTEHPLPKGGYSRRPIAWAVMLDLEGNLLGIADLRENVRGLNRGKEFLVPDPGRTSNIEAGLLADNGEYALGIPPEGEDPGKTAQRHQALVTNTRECFEATGEPAVGAVLRFLERLPESLGGQLPAEFSPKDWVLFQVLTDDGLVVPIDLPAVKAFWTARFEERYIDAEAGNMMCLVCGRTVPVVAVVPTGIKGVPGTQGNGLTLISANHDNFESYGLKRSQIAPICLECAETSHQMLNEILKGNVGAAYILRNERAYVAWTRGKPFNAYEQAAFPQAEDVVELLKAAGSGRKGAALLDPTPYFAAPLSAAAKRLVVRGWLQTTVGEVQANLARFFRAQGVTLDGPQKPMGVFALAKALQKEGDDRDLPGHIVDALFNHALYGHRLPPQLMSMAIQRCRRERENRRATDARMALIRMVLAEKGGCEAMEERLEQSRAYHCGRLLAVMEHIQQTVSRDVNTTIIDRYFSKASMAPGAVFPNLERLARKHLAKIGKRNKKLAEHLSKILDDVNLQAGPYPRTLNLEEQGHFMLGYHTQRQARYQKRAATDPESSAGTAEDAEEEN